MRRTGPTRTRGAAFSRRRSRAPGRSGGGGGFTLIEILLALFVVSFFLTGATAWMVSISSVWANRGDDHYFTQHVDGVTLFLNKVVTQSGGLGEEETEPVIWDSPPGWSNLEDPLLTIRLKDKPALLVSRESPLPGVTCGFYFDPKEGLSFLWYSRLQEIEDVDDLSRTLISPFVRKIEYCYYDEEDEEWTIEEDPEEDNDGNFLLPNFLRLTFQEDPEEASEAREVLLFIPASSQSLPLF